MVEFDKVKIRDKEILIGVVLLMVPGFLLGGFLAYSKIIDNGLFLKRWPKPRLFFLVFDSLIVALIGYFFLRLSPLQGTYWMILFWSLPFSFLAYAVGLIIVPIFWADKIDTKLEARHLREKISKNSMKRYKEDVEIELANKDRIPLGISHVEHKLLSLASESRDRHVIITGKNGMGKTSFALTMARHDLFWGLPVIFIDPKSNHKDIETARIYAQKYGRQKDLRFFSTVLKDDSCYYNPLKLGSPSEKAGKVVFAINLTHEHWSALAATFLTVIFEIYELLETEPTLNELEMLFISKESLAEFLSLPSKMKKTPYLTRLLSKIHSQQKLKDEAFSGLQAGLIELNSKDITDVMNPSPDRKEVCIRKAIQKNHFLHLDLSIGSDSLKRAIGRFFIRDLALCSDAVQHNSLSYDAERVGIFIDELGSFADKDSFPHYFQRARSARFSNTVMFQSRASLNQISENLFSQLSANSETVIDFRAGDSVDLNSISERPGTRSFFKKSRQIDKKSVSNETGMETVSEGGEFILDPNLVREFGRGQCAIYTQEQEKEYGGRNILGVVWSWDAKGAAQKALTKEEVLSRYADKYPDSDASEKNYSRFEKQLLGLDPRLWHKRLNYGEVAQARALRVKLQQSKA